MCCVVGLLSGCAFLTDSFFLAKFDPIEYRSIVDIRALARNSILQCDDGITSKTNARYIVNEIDFLILYDEPFAHNTDVQKSLVELHNIAAGLHQQYSKEDNVSVAFCKLKFSTIDVDAGIIQKVIGSKPK